MTTANEELRQEILPILGPAGVRTRAMFGGHGLYLGDRYFGLIADGRLWFRTDEDSRDAYLAQGMPAFQPAGRPRGPKTVDKNFEVPPAVRADPDLLLAWALRAAQARR